MLFNIPQGAGQPHNKERQSHMSLVLRLRSLCWMNLVPVAVPALGWPALSVINILWLGVRQNQAPPLTNRLALHIDLTSLSLISPSVN